MTRKLEEAVEWACRWNKRWSPGREVAPRPGATLACRLWKGRATANVCRRKGPEHSLELRREIIAKHLEDVALDQNLHGTFHYGTDEIARPYLENGPLVTGLVILGDAGEWDERLVIAPNLHILRPAYREVIDATPAPAWDTKKSSCIYRAGVVMHPRVKACKLSRQHPAVLDAGFADPKYVHKYLKYPRVHADRGAGNRYIAPFMPVAEMATYKYQLGIGGWKADHWKLLSNSVFIDIMPWYHWVHAFLEPGVDYIQTTLDKLPETIAWCRDNDEACQEMAARARQAMLDHCSADGAVRFTRAVCRKLFDLAT